MAAQTQPVRTVLLVEDSVRIRRLVRAALAASNWRIIEAGTAERALKLVAQEDGIDLLVTDLTLPGMSGIELATRLRERYPGMTTLCMSGHALPSAPHEGVHFIEKPFHPDDLLSKVKELLGTG